MWLKGVLWRLAKWLVNTNLFISIGAVCMVWQTYFVLGRPWGITPLVVLVFAATLFVYNWQRLISHNKPTYGSMEGMHGWMEQHIWWTRSFIVVGLLGMAISVWWLSTDTQVTLLVLGLISTTYALPVPLSKTYRIRLRDIGVLKPFILAGVWAFATALLPIMEGGGIAPLSSLALLIFAKRFLFMAAICIPFDIKDMEFDRITMRYPTLPIVIGVKATRILALFFLLLFQLLVCWLDGWSAAGIGISLSNIFTAVLLIYPGAHDSEYFYTFGVDSTMIVQFLLVLLAAKCL